MRLRILLLATLSLVLTGCFSVDRVRLAEPEPAPVARACTEIGCRSLLTVELTDADVVGDTTYNVEVCVDDDCVSSRVTVDVRNDQDEAVLGEDGGVVLRADQDLVEYSLAGDGYGETAAVSFTLTDADGNVVAEANDQEVPIERSQPNGPGCPPLCLTGRLTV